MKHNKLIMACAAIVAGSMEQVFRPGFQPFAEQQQQAKTSRVEVDTDWGAADPDATIQSVAAADPLRTTIGGLVVAAAKATDEVILAAGLIPAVSLQRRLVIQKGENYGAGVIAALDAATNCVKSAELTFDGGAQNNAPMTNAVANGTGISTAVNAALAAAKPSFSLQSIVNKLEDLLIAQEGAHTGVIVVDQDTEKVYLMTCPVANEATLAALINQSTLNGVDLNAAFDLDATPASTAENQFGE